MNKIQYLSLIGLLSLVLSPGFSVAQITDALTDKSQPEELFFCKNKDYQFLIEGNHYFENSKVYVCPKNLPVDIAVVEATNQTPVFSTFTWTINGTASSENSNTISIKDSNFNGNKSTLNVSFTDPATNTAVSLKLKLNRDIQLKFSESAKKYQFDGNKISKYIDHVSYGEKLGTPWNFIENGKLDILKARATKNKGYYAVNNIMSNNSSLMINPNSLSTTPEDDEFNFSGSGKNIIEVNGCHETDPELLLFTESRDLYEIQFVQVCETDDDIQVHPVGTVLTSPTDVCIDGGVDLTIDEMYAPAFLKGDDKLDINILTGKAYVQAGVNLKCETKAHPNSPPDCPPSINNSDFIDAANTVLEKVAIDFENIGTTTIYFNYNVYLEDGIMEKREQNYLHDERHGSTQAGTPEVFVVDDLGLNQYGKTRQGSATANPGPGGNTIIGLHTMALDVNDATPYVLVHELGHAIWNLIHPGSPGSGQFGIDDLDNFMHGASDEINNWNVRRYQFHEMH